MHCTVGEGLNFARRSLVHQTGEELLMWFRTIHALQPFPHTNPSACVQLLQVNVVALTHLTRLLLPGMISRGYGRIMNVASIAAFYPGPLTACYNASKAFVMSLSEALSNELRDTGVTVTTLCPGPTDTRFAERAGLTGTKAFTQNVMDPATVARIGYDAMMTGKALAVT